MKVNFLCFANNETGFGHWYRSVALAKHIRNQGSQVTIIGDRVPPDNLLCHRVPFGDQTIWRGPLSQQCDWLVIDLPDEAPDWIYDHCQQSNIKTCVLNGVGHQVGDRADLRIVQGLGREEYSGVDYIILRKSVFEAKAIRRPIMDWFVFGGAADKMGLTKRFPDFQKMSFTISDQDWQAGDSHDNGFLVAASQCRRACVAMGMTVWELAAMGIPTYVYSLTAQHLSFAKKMAGAGYIRAHRQVGLPDTEMKIRDFLGQPFTPSGRPIDGRASERILDLMQTL